MNALNTPEIVSNVINRFDDAGAPCLLFGGRAEEALGLCAPHAHADIDLLLPAPSFHQLDHMLAAQASNFEEIAPKRFAHKRSFWNQGVMVEVILVQSEHDALCTWFWGDVRFEWEKPLTESCTLRGHRLQSVSTKNLQRYRTHHRSTQPWRWKDQSSPVRQTNSLNQTQK